MSVKINKARRITTTLVALAIIVCGAGIHTFARFISSKSETAVIQAEAFYFTSDKLSTDAPVYSVCGDSFTVNLSNSEFGNRSGSDIMFTLTVTGGTCADSGGSVSTSGNVRTYTGCTLPRSGENEAVKTLSITAEEDSVTVVATSVSPYVKTLSATFRRAFTDNATYRVTDFGVYSLLEIFTGAETSEITVNYGDNLSPDNTNPLMSDWTGAERSGTLSGLTAQSHYSLIFFENAEDDYSVAESAINAVSRVISIG